MKVVPLKNHFTITVVRVLKAGAAMNVIKVWDHRPMHHGKILYQKQLSMLQHPFSILLAIRVFLRGVKKTSNQNANESFNRVLKSLCPIELPNSPTAASFVVSFFSIKQLHGLQTYNSQ